MVEHNHDEAIHFLKWHAEKGPWTLTAIPPDGGRTDTCQFDPETEHDCRTWLQQHHDRQNGLFFMVNPPMGFLNKKAEKADVKELAYLHVDLDAKGDGNDSPQLPALLAKLNAFNPPPSGVIFSGGGYHGYWKLDTPVFLGGNEQSCEQAEAYNKHIAKQLGGDHCHHAARIMRLPGTVNFPNALKRGWGRVPTLAAVVGQLTDKVWGLEEFTAAPIEPAARGDKGPAASHFELPSDLPLINDLDIDLPTSVKDRTKALIVEGRDPTDPNAHGSRSETMW